MVNIQVQKCHMDGIGYRGVCLCQTDVYLTACLLNNAIFKALNTSNMACISWIQFLSTYGNLYWKNGNYLAVKTNIDVKKQSCCLWHAAVYFTACILVSSGNENDFDGFVKTNNTVLQINKKCLLWNIWITFFM